MLEFWLVFMLLAPDGTILQHDLRQVKTETECKNAVTETKNPDGSWFTVKCSVWRGV